jgi:molybdopterin-containing oxidoreductase family membrane subunit
MSSSDDKTYQDHWPAKQETPLVLGEGHSYASVSDKIGNIVLTRKFGMGWWLIFGITAFFVMILTSAVGYLFARGVGIWGINMPVAWGFAIINFVWWVGIGHAGTFISAFLLLLRQDWRTSINRFAEAMTLFAVACAGMFPLLHMGRPWMFFWLMPYPNHMWLWPQFRSPLVWDVFAVSTYLTVSLLFWYVGLLPDLATLRDKAKNKPVRMAFGVVALGWTGSARHWQRYQSAYLLLAALAAPLVISVHSVVGMDFAGSQLPGWHSTIFPPYFVAGAIFSGFAMVLTLAIPLRAAFNLRDMITLKHLENCARLMLVTGLIVAYGYTTEVFYAWYSGNGDEWYLTINRMIGPYWMFYWMLIFCNILTPQLLWFKWIRQNIIVLFIISLIVNVGMWLERFVIIITSLHRDFIPSSWGMYHPTIWDFATFFGTIGFFLMCFVLFCRFLPVISIFEMRELVEERKPKKAGGHGHHGVVAPSELASSAFGVVGA